MTQSMLTSYQKYFLLIITPNIDQIGMTPIEARQPEIYGSAYLICMMTLNP